MKPSGSNKKRSKSSSKSSSKRDDGSGNRQIPTEENSPNSSAGNNPGPSRTQNTEAPELRSKGVLLQHRLRVSLDTQQEIVDSGQIMDDDFFSFTKEEDEKIRKNWEFYAKHLKFTGHIFEYVGFDADGMTTKTKQKMHSLLYKMDFWPFLCKGLNNRYAKLIQERISYIFHPFYKEGYDYDLKEIERRLDNDEPMLEIAHTLQVPPRFIHRKLIIKAVHEEVLLKPRDRITIIKLLYESIIEKPTNRFSSYNFDWKKFRNKCRENSIDPPISKTVNNTFRTQFNDAERSIFKYLDPAPSLESKLFYIHETFARYALKNASYRKTEVPYLNMETLFTVVFESYNKNGPWNPPQELEIFAAKVDLDIVRNRLDQVFEKRKRLSEIARLDAAKRIKLAEMDDSYRNKTLNEQLLEISSIHAESSSDPINIENPDENLDNVLTDFELSLTNTSSFIRRNETILAAGGKEIGGEIDPNNTTLGGNLSESQQKSQQQKEKVTIQLDMSQDIWSQLVS